MAIIDWIASYGAWSWIVSGVIFLLLETMVPSGFMASLGISAVIVGLLGTFIPMGAPVEWGIFGVIALASFVVWMRFFRRASEPSDRPYLNRRAERFVGHEVVLDEPISDGYGRVALGDTVWRVAGPDLKAGQRVRIIGHDGAVLRVELA
jgi:inner membrane protein